MPALGWLMNLNFAGGQALELVAGPYKVPAAELFSTGQTAGQVGHTGQDAGELFSTGQVAGEIGGDR